MAVFTISLEDKVSVPAKNMIASLGDFLKQIVRAKSPLFSLGVAIRSSVINGKDSFVSSVRDMKDNWKANWKTIVADFAIDSITNGLQASVDISIKAMKLLGEAVSFGFQKAIEISERRDQLRSAFEALGGGGGAGDRALAMLDRLSDVLPYTTNQMLDWSRGLMSAGLSGKALESGIKAIASANAIMGSSGASAAETLIKRFQQAGETGMRIKMDRRFLKTLNEAGVSTTALANELGVAPNKLLTMATSAGELGTAFQNALIKSGKQPLEDLGLRWDTIMTKVKGGVDGLFSDLAPSVKPFMREVQSLFSEFYKGGGVIKNNKTLVTSVFRTVFDLARQGVRQVHLSFLELQIGFYKTAIALQPVINAFRRMLPAGAALAIVTWVVKGLAVVFTFLAVAVFIALIPLMILVGVVIAIGAAIAKLIGWISDAVGWFSKLGGAGEQAGKDLDAGMVKGMLGGKSGVTSAAHDVGNTALSGLETSMQIASPSKAGKVIGRFLPAGVELGIDEGSRGVEVAAERVGGAAVGGMARGAAAGPGRAAAAGGGFTIGDVTIIIQGAASDALSLTEEAVSTLFERLALQQGLVRT